MKRKRQETILKLIEEFNLTTQEQLLEKLHLHGFNVTQATVSRDIKELRLVKTMNGSSEYSYAQQASAESTTPLNFNSILKDSITKTDWATNICVLQCRTGMANAGCVAIDGMELENVVGTIAGDDTIFILCRESETAKQLHERFQSLIS